MTNERMVLAHGRVVTPEGVLEPGWVRLTGERITKVAAGEPDEPVDLDLTGMTLLPGFVDMHVHGGGGGSYVSDEPERIATAAEFHRRHGTTTTMASLISARPDVLERQVAAVAEVAESGLLAGIHLEGPWISEEKRGAHDRSVLRLPAPAEVGRLLQVGRGQIRMVTMAPELAGAAEATERLRQAGVVVAVGHTAADYRQTRQAFEQGARVGTHLFNAMPSLHHREPGAVAALLEDPRVLVELIADGHHVHPAMLGLAIRAAGVDRVALVTDAMDAAGMPDGRYRLGGRAVRVTEGLVKLEDGDSIAGSTLTMQAAVRFLVRQVGVGLPQAAAMAATNPARALGLTEVGAIRPGLRADLVALDDADLSVRFVLAGGSRVESVPE